MNDPFCQRKFNVNMYEALIKSRTILKFRHTFFQKGLKKRACPGKRGLLVTLRTGYPFDSYVFHCLIGGGGELVGAILVISLREKYEVWRESVCLG